MYKPTNTHVQGKELPVAFSFDFNSPVVFTFKCSFIIITIIIITITIINCNWVVTRGSSPYTSTGKKKIHKRNNTKNTVNTSTHITKTPHTLQNKLKHPQYKIRPYEIVTI